MAVSNIERFDETVGKIFAELYEAFPLPHNLKAESYLTSPMVFNEVYGMEVPDQDDAEFFIATARWLIQTGYIYGEVQPYIRVSDAVLTAKGLEVLKAVPESITNSGSIGQALVDSVAEGGKEATKTLASQVLSFGARWVAPIVGIDLG